MYVMKFQIVFALVVTISIWISAHGAEPNEEAYWKMNLSDDIIMPKVVKEALLGLGNNNDFDPNGSNLKGLPMYKLLPGANRRNQATKVYGARSNQPSLINKGKGSKLPTVDYVQFFFEKNLMDSKSKMKLDFYMNNKEAKFMSSSVANPMPFSSTKLPEILQSVAVNPKSWVAELIGETLWLCESKPIKGEQMSCATSLKSMVDYAKSYLGDQVKVFSTDVDKYVKLEYKIENAKKIKNNKNMVCHKMVYPYAVFYCHTSSKTDVYKVSLIDDTGKKVSTIAVCHKDTSSWYPGHIAFQLLKVKPGSVPICHFLNVDAMIWVSN